VKSRTTQEQLEAAPLCFSFSTEKRVSRAGSVKRSDRRFVYFPFSLGEQMEEITVRAHTHTHTHTHSFSFFLTFSLSSTLSGSLSPLLCCHSVSVCPLTHTHHLTLSPVC